MFCEIADYPLPEDLEVRGFVGLRDPLVKLNFAAGLENGIPDDVQHSCRSYRCFYVYVLLFYLLIFPFYVAMYFCTILNRIVCCIGVFTATFYNTIPTCCLEI